MYTLTINVTQEHINTGVCGSAAKCAIANAVRDIFPNASVGMYIILIDRCAYYEELRKKGVTFEAAQEVGSKFTVKTPEDAGIFIGEFDRGEVVKPISFTLDIPDAYIETINIDEVKKTLENHPTLTLYEKVLC